MQKRYNIEKSERERVGKERERGKERGIGDRKRDRYIIQRDKHIRTAS